MFYKIETKENFDIIKSMCDEYKVPCKKIGIVKDKTLNINDKINLEIDKISNFLSVTISCYLNKETRDKGLNPFTSKKFILKLSTIDLSKNILDEVYKQIKVSIAETDKFTKVVFFENAIDA